MAELRLHHRRRRFGRLRAGQPAAAKRQAPRAAARGGRQRPELLDPYADRLRQDFYDRRVNWMYKTEPEPGDGRPRHLLAARQGARRLELDQRHGLYPRPAPAISTTGRRPAIRAGGGRTCCRISRRPENKRSARRPGWRRRAAAMSSTIEPPCIRSVTSISRRRGGWASSNPDLNGRDHEGVGHLPDQHQAACACSRRGAYLRPAMRRPNLQGRDRRAATRILFEGARAIGVDIVRGGHTNARLPAVKSSLPAGSVNSPQLLQLSGVGPAAVCSSWHDRSCATCRGRQEICRTISAWITSTARACRR